MKKYFTLIILSLFLFSCGSSKKIENSIQSGNFIGAFNKSIEKVRSDKNKNSNQDYIPLLKEAYYKAALQDISEINSLKKINDHKKVYSKYLNLDIRQDEIKALLPLYYTGQEIVFNFSDYTKNIEDSKNKYAAKLYDSGKKLINSTKEDARTANAIFEELQFIHPTYKSDIPDLIIRSKDKGSSFVLVEATSKINNYPISNDILDQISTISTSNFNNKWVIIHNDKQTGYNYDFVVNTVLENIVFVPKKLNSELVKQEKQIQDGWKYVYDGNGNVAKDKDGNDIKEAKFIVVQAELKLNQQLKSSRINGTTIIKNTSNNTILSSTPLFGEAKFENVFAQYRGDQRAIEEKYYEVLKNKEVAYPNDEEFIKYSLDNYKQQLSALIQQQQF